METSTERAVSSIQLREATVSEKRYERKYVFIDAFWEDILDYTILNNPFGFQEIYTERRVNNIYFDNQERSLYHMNVSGDGWREKFRLRWYGDIFAEVENPVLEIKRKYGEVGEKISFLLTGFSYRLPDLSGDELHKKIIQTLSKCFAPSIWQTRFAILTPVLCNTYVRRYFLSHCGMFRITLDYKMNFGAAEGTFQLKSKAYLLDDVVLELKYKTDVDSEARVLSQYLQTRISRHSKYVRGMDLIHGY